FCFFIRFTMPKLPKHCIFCGITGASKEHLFGDWLKKRLFPDTSRDTHTQGHISWPEGGAEPTVTTQKRPGHSGSKTLKIVCEDCNNIWLGKIDEFASMVLPPILDGRTTSITPRMQRILASWAVKVGMVAPY